MALDLISESRNNKFIIFLDSLSVLESLKNRKFDHPLIIRILCKLKNLSNDNICDIDIDMLDLIKESGFTLKKTRQMICWVPSHTGISGNDKRIKQPGLS